jgi:hypothetical protein
MFYFELHVKTSNGWKDRYICAESIGAFGKYLCRYYKGKNYYHTPLSKEKANILLACNANILHIKD